MELKDLILSTLAELEKNSDETEEELEKKEHAIKSNQKKIKKIEDYENEDEVDDFTSLKDSLKSKPKPIQQQESNTQPQTSTENELAETHILSIDEGKFLTSLRERILVLFEGLQSPNNTKLESKIDIIINFLEYQLSIIDERLESKNTKHR